MPDAPPEWICGKDPALGSRWGTDCWQAVVLTSPTGEPVLQPVPRQNPFVDQFHVRIRALANPVWESLL